METRALRRQEAAISVGSGGALAIGGVTRLFPIGGVVFACGLNWSWLEYDVVMMCGNRSVDRHFVQFVLAFSMSVFGDLVVGEITGWR